ncbi:Acyl-CoA dehydrogenase [Rhodovastum atsumiense]|uniref:Acyl-CoA dehydrogenase n=1 Tax=Rhodovastum atsumiense TaxID=504468 RepID=A0A5M6IZR9_9PROT|nr:acyl-CoA dehydrogenase family protein [Rhodovastum atsumiense]KAA5613832.1 acyl-CoA dehydrogenase [Rhodovastum atsumiense]CAH2601941.1 Acyl-CoA dehydrogenase [Rhodovastum atsumiense]
MTIATAAVISPAAPAPLDPDSAGFQALLDGIALGAVERERERIHPFEPLAQIRAARLGALRLPRADGGLGASNRQLYDVIIRLADADANVAHSLRSHFIFVERYLLGPRLGPVQETWRQAVAEGAIFGIASGETQTKTVGNAVENTLLTPDGDGFRLNGTKFYSTGTLYADYVQVRARLPDGALASAILPISRPGVEAVDDWDGFGQRVTGSGTTLFQDVRVEPHEVIPDEADGFARAPYSNTAAQLFLTAVNAGILRATLRDAAALVRRRDRNFYYAPSERPADDPVLQQTVGVIASNAFVAGAAVLAAADALDRLDARRHGPDAAAAAHEAALLAAQAKIVVDDLAIRSGSLLFDVGGASATRRGPDLDRHWRNARTISSHNPATYKAVWVGNHVINGTPLPANSFF